MTDLRKIKLQPAANFSYLHSPERRLLAAILMRAINDILQKKLTTECRKETQRRALEWLMDNSTDGAELRPHSFLWVANGLDLAPQCVRQIVLQKLTKQILNEASCLLVDQQSSSLSISNKQQSSVPLAQQRNS